MRKNARSVLMMVAVAIAGVSAAAEAAPRLAISRVGYRFTQIEKVPGHEWTYDVTSRASVINLGDPAMDVTASLTSASPGIVVLDGTMSFGNVPRTSPFKPKISRDTFTLRITFPARPRPRNILHFVLAGLRSLR